MGQKYEELNNKELLIDSDDSIEDLRFKNELEARIYYSIRGQPHILDVDLKEETPKFERT